MFHCLPDSAWADGNLAEAAEQLVKMVEHRNQSQPNPGPQGHGTPCILFPITPAISATLISMSTKGCPRPDGPPCISYCRFYAPSRPPRRAPSWSSSRPRPGGYRTPGSPRFPCRRPPFSKTFLQHTQTVIQPGAPGPALQNCDRRSCSGRCLAEKSAILNVGGK